MSLATPPELKKLGFEESDGYIRRRLIVAIQGRPKRGKTHLALGFPGPIALFDTDKGTEGIISKFPDKKVYLMDVNLFPDQDPSQKEFDRVLTAWNDVLSSPSIKSIVADSATDLYELARMGILGRLEGVRARNYGGVHAVFRRLYRAGLSGDKSVALIHKVKAQYVNDARTGKFELAGFSETSSWAEVVLEMFRPGDEDDYPEDFGLRILDSRHNPALNGQVMIGPMATFPFLAAAVLGGSPNEWM
jgi:hypothetical protein